MRLCFVSLGALAFLFGANAIGELVYLGPKKMPHVFLHHNPESQCSTYAPLASKNFQGPYMFDRKVGKIRIDRIISSNFYQVHIPLQPKKVDVGLPARIEQANRLYIAIRNAMDANLRLCTQLNFALGEHLSDCGDTCSHLYNRHYFLAHYYKELLPSLRGCDDEQQIQDILKVVEYVNRASDLLFRVHSALPKHYSEHAFPAALRGAAQCSNALGHRPGLEEHYLLEHISRRRKRDREPNSEVT